MRELRIYAAVAALTVALAALVLVAGSVSQVKAATGGPVFVSGDDAEDHCAGTDCGGLYPAIFSSAVTLSQSPGTGILAIGVGDDDTASALPSWNAPGNGGPNVPITIVTGPAINSVDFGDFDVIFVPSNEADGGGEPPGISDSDLTRLNARKADIADFVNNQGGGLIVLTEADSNPALAFGFLPLPLQFTVVEYVDAEPTSAMAELAPSANSSNLDHENYHNIWTGPPGFLGLKVLAVTPDVPDGQGNPSAAILGGAQVILATSTPTATATVTATATATATPTVTATATPTATATATPTATVTATPTPTLTVTPTPTPTSTPTPTPTSTATPTKTSAPAALPPTGGDPVMSAGLPWLALAIGAAVVIWGALVLTVRRRRTP